MKKTCYWLTVLLVLLLTISSCKLADIRTYKSQLSDDINVDKNPKQLLANAYTKMGLDKLTDYETYSLQFKEEYFGIGKMINNFKVNPVKVEIDYIPRKFIGKATVKNGKLSGDEFFYNEGKTFYRSSSGKEKESHKIAEKWIHYRQYFLEFPARIQEANAFAYAGDTVLNGKSYFLVIASWNTVEPQKDIDQYLIGINQETYFIDFIQFTVRDVAKFVANTAVYEAFIEKNGIHFPSSIAIRGKKYNSNKFYHMSVENIEYNKVTKTEITEF